MTVKSANCIVKSVRKTLAFVYKIFSNTALEGKDQSGWKSQRHYVKKVWDDKSFGVLRLFQLFLSLIRFLDITYWTIWLFQSTKPPCRQLINEGIVIVRGLLFFWILYHVDSRSSLAQAVVIYFLSTTVLHLLAVVFLGDIYSRPISIRRSQLIVLWNYVEVTAGFGFLYLALGVFKEQITPSKALYFSFITSATVGYGDLAPIDSVGQHIVILQIMTMLLFATVVFTYFSFHPRDEGSKLQATVNTQSPRIVDR